MTTYHLNPFTASDYSQGDTATPTIGTNLFNYLGAPLYIFANRAYMYGSSGQYGGLACVDALPADVNVSVVARHKAHQAAFKLQARVVDSSNFYEAYVDDVGYSIAKVVAGVRTSLGSGSLAVTSNVDAVYEFRLIGNTLQLLKDSAVLIAPVTDATFTAAGAMRLTAAVLDAGADEGDGWHFDTLTIADPPSSGVRFKSYFLSA